MCPKQQCVSARSASLGLERTGRAPEAPPPPRPGSSGLEALLTELAGPLPPSASRGARAAEGPPAWCRCPRPPGRPAGGRALPEGSLNRARAAAAPHALRRPHAGAGHGLPPRPAHSRAGSRSHTVCTRDRVAGRAEGLKCRTMQVRGGAECGGTWGPRGPMAGSGDHVGPRGSQDRREHWRLLEPGRVRGRRGHRGTALRRPHRPRRLRPPSRGAQPAAPVPTPHPPGWSSRRKLHSRSEKLELKPGGSGVGGESAGTGAARGQGRGGCLRLRLHGTHGPALKPTRMKRSPHTEG